MINNTKKQYIGKANYDSNLSINQEIQTVICEYHSIFKERLLQLLDNFILINIREKLEQRQSLIQRMRENIVKYEEHLNEKIQPAYKLSDDSAVLIKYLYVNFSNFKSFSDRIKNELNFTSYESNFKIIFRSVFDFIDQIHEVLCFYPKVFQSYSEKAQKKFYVQILSMFNDLESQMNSISV